MTSRTVKYRVWSAPIVIPNVGTVWVRERLDITEWVFVSTETGKIVAGPTAEPPVLDTDWTIRFGDLVSIPYPPERHGKWERSTIIRDGVPTFGALLWARSNQTVADRMHGLEYPTVWLRQNDTVLFGGQMPQQNTPTQVTYRQPVVELATVDGIVTRTETDDQWTVNVGCGCQGKGWALWTP